MTESHPHEEGKVPYDNSGRPDRSKGFGMLAFSFLLKSNRLFLLPLTSSFQPFGVLFGAFDFRQLSALLEIEEVLASVVHRYLKISEGMRRLKFAERIAAA